MNNLSLAACTGLLLALPATAQAQADAHAQSAGQAQHDHSAPPAPDAQPDAAPTAERRMKMGQHMEDCRCPCCEMMRQHDMASPDDNEARAAPAEQHQHDAR